MCSLFAISENASPHLSVLSSIRSSLCYLRVVKCVNGILLMYCDISLIFILHSWVHSNHAGLFETGFISCSHLRRSNATEFRACVCCRARIVLLYSFTGSVY